MSTLHPRGHARRPRCTAVHRQSRRFALQEILNGQPDGIAGRFLIRPVVDAQLLCLQCFEQFDRDSLDALDLAG